VVPPTTPLEIFHQQLLDDCARWLADCRGLAPRTIAARLGQGRQFLDWLGERGSQERLVDLSVADLDAYLQFRALSVRRSTRAELTLCLRSFVSYLHRRGLLARDLSRTITGPRNWASHYRSRTFGVRRGKERGADALPFQANQTPHGYRSLFFQPRLA
jgi:integrase/recombinase XerD